MKTVILILCLTASVVAQTPPKPNGLFLRRARDIQAELARVQAEVPSTAKALTRAQAEVTKAQAAATANKDPKQAAFLQSKLTAAQQGILPAQRRATLAPQRVTQLQAQLADWEAKTLKTYKADPTKFKTDWAAGAIVPK
jgi:chromosome segregation ATPase